MPNNVSLFIMAQCPKCDGPVTLREARATGRRFLGCDNYPECKWTCSYDEVYERLSRRILQLEEELAGGHKAPRRKFDPKAHPHLRDATKDIQ